MNPLHAITGLVGFIGIILLLGKVPAADLSQVQYPSNLGSGKWSW